MLFYAVYTFMKRCVRVCAQTTDLDLRALDLRTATRGECLSFRTGGFNLWTINHPLKHLGGKAQEITVSGGLSKQYARLLLLRISEGFSMKLDWIRLSLLLPTCLQTQSTIYVPFPTLSVSPSTSPYSSLSLFRSLPLSLSLSLSLYHSIFLPLFALSLSFFLLSVILFLSLSIVLSLSLALSLSLSPPYLTSLSTPSRFKTGQGSNPITEPHRSLGGSIGGCNTRLRPDAQSTAK